MAAAFIFRLFLLRFQYAVFMDEAHYARMGAAFAQGDWRALFHAFWSPGYPFWIGVFGSIFKHYEITARMINIIAGSLTILPIHAMSKRIFNSRVAGTAALFYALYPSVANMGTSVMAEPTFILFGLTGFWLGMQALEKESFIQALLTGIAFGFAYLCKPEGFSFFLIYGAILGVLILYSMIRRRKIRYLRFSLLYLIGFLLIASSYLGYLRNEAGYWLISGKSAAFQEWHQTFFTPENDDTFHDLNADCTSFKNDTILHFGTFLSAERTVGSAFHFSVKLFIIKYMTYLYQVIKETVPTMLTFLGAVLFALGLFARPVQKSALPLFFAIVFYVGFYWFAVIPMFVVETRYLMSMYPFVTLFMGQGLWVLIEWIEKTLGQILPTMKKKQPFAITLGMLLVFFFLFLPGLAGFSKISASSAGVWDDAVELKLAGEWIKAHSTETPVIMAQNKTVDFYAGNYNLQSGASFPRDTQERILRYAKHQNVRYFVIAERYLSFNPDLKTWIDSPPASLKLLHALSGPSGQKVWIFTWADHE